MSNPSTDRPSLTQVIVEINNLETILEQFKRMNEPEIVNQLIRKLNREINPYYPSSAARSFEIEPLEAQPDESGLQVSNVIFKSADEQQPLEEERTNRVGRRQYGKVKQSGGNNIKIPTRYPQRLIEEVQTRKFTQEEMTNRKQANKVGLIEDISVSSISSANSDDVSQRHGNQNDQTLTDILLTQFDDINKRTPERRNG